MMITRNFCGCIVLLAAIACAAPTPAPTPVPAPPVNCPPILTENVEKAGTWMIGEKGESCDEVCGKTRDQCYVCGNRRAGEFHLEASAMDDIASRMACGEQTCSDANETVHPSMDVTSCCFTAGFNSRCDSKKTHVRRLCCCGATYCNMEVLAAKESCVSQYPCSWDEGTKACDCEQKASSGAFSATPLFAVIWVFAFFGA